MQLYSGFIEESHNNHKPSTLLKTESDSIDFTILLARRTISFRWKDPLPPSFMQWVQDLFFIFIIEKVKFSLRGTTHTLYKQWNPYMSDLKESILLSPMSSCWHNYYVPLMWITSKPAIFIFYSFGLFYFSCYMCIWLCACVFFSLSFPSSSFAHLLIVLIVIK